MKRILMTTAFVVALLLCIAPSTQASDLVADHSAQISIDTIDSRDADLSIQRQAIYNVLRRYNSPMKDDVDAFMKVSDIYNMHPYFLPAIAGLESGFGKHTAANTQNPFGWGGGRMKFADWEDAIMTVGAGLRMRYIDNGATTISAIAKIYAPPSTTWAGKVNFFMKQFQKEEDRIRRMQSLLVELS